MIYTFYSYKGGVGRTMALANVAELFYQAGLKVLMVDWDLEAPGLERFFPMEMERILDKPGVMDMLLGYKEQMAQELPDAESGEESLPFEKLDSFIVDIHPDASAQGRLWFLPAGQRSKEHFADYANAVLTFDWQDFYDNWDAEQYFEWLRQQFEQMADVVLIDSRTGVTEMSGVCTYQLADTVVMFCAANQQSLHGTYEMAQNFKRPEVQHRRRGRPLNVLIIPARVERAESDLLDKFQGEFVKLFKDSVPQTEEINIWTLWQSGIPYIPKYAFTEALAVRESGLASAEDMVKAFRRLSQVMEHLAGLQVGAAERSKAVDRRITKLRVFVASPEDVSEERKRLRAVIEELNHGLAKDKGLVLQFIGWETDAWLGIRQDAQDVINRQIGPYDIFVGIMWKRFGTPTRRAGSGTEEQLEQAYSLWSEYGRPRIMLYFNKAPFSPSSADEVEQVAKVLAFKERAADKGALYWEYNGPEEFEKFVRQHLTKEILRWAEYEKPVGRPPMIIKLPLQFYQVLFNELDIYITQFEQLQRDYDRELRGEQLVFAADFSELHNYMYPYSPESPRSSLNQYVFNTLENPFTLMPGAVGELLTDLERALPSTDVLERDPLAAYEDVARFIYEFPTAVSNEERIIELYARAELQLKKAWGELFRLVMQGVHHTALHAVKSLIDQGRLSPIQGVREVTHFPSDVRQRAQWVRSDLNLARPGRVRNNQVDTIDFAVTWLLNGQERKKRGRYLSIYTQSRAFINACTARRELRWQDDYLVRGARYLQFRTRLQELFPSTKQRREFLAEWAARCRQLQKEMSNLVDLEKELPELKEPSLRLLDLYRQFDEECRTPLSFTGEVGERGKLAASEEAARLFALLKESGEFRGRTGDAYEILKTYLWDLRERLALFAPDKVRAPDAEAYMENLVRWLGSENLEE